MNCSFRLADLYGCAIIRHTMMQGLIPITSWAVIPAILVATAFQGKPYAEDAAPASPAAAQPSQSAEDTAPTHSKDPSNSGDSEVPTGFGPIRAPAEMVGRAMWSVSGSHAKTRGCDAYARPDHGRGIPHRHVLPPNANGRRAVLLSSVATAVRPHAPPA
ncbi:MAG: hypothetical protein ACE5E5_06250 [Phycisphaerae bacterium]